VVRLFAIFYHKDTSKKTTSKYEYLSENGFEKNPTQLERLYMIATFILYANTNSSNHSRSQSHEL
jgi:hypothetical protein